MTISIVRNALGIAGSAFLMITAGQQAAAQQPPQSEAPRQLAGVASHTADPLLNFYGNTLVCLAAVGGADLCHQWINADGTFINIDQGGAHTGHYTVSQPDNDGKIRICYYFDTRTTTSPSDLLRGGAAGPPPGAAGAAGAGGPSGGAPGANQGVTVCKSPNSHTTCQRNVDPATIAPQDQRYITHSAEDAFYKGMCYPMGRHEVGDVWFETGDPMPRDLGTDKVMLVRGRR
ncbi:MAG: hypothetical protein QM718_15375 [Steroidobacteraceae bacterium]